jgi:RNA-directed DNA polymerase
LPKIRIAKLDHFIWEKLWQWSCRRHPNKGKRWIKRKYFKQIGSKDWIFKLRTGETLIKASNTKIIRHIKIKGEYNPFTQNGRIL